MSHTNGRSIQNMIGVVMHRLVREFVYGPKVRPDQVTLSGPDLQIELVTASLAFAIEICSITYFKVVA